MDVNTYLKTSNKPTSPRSDFRSAKRITCNDGVSLSVQASNSHYCSPRENDAYPYANVEVGFPSIEPPSTWLSYCEDVEHPTDTVYGYIPVELVDSFIAEHGGIKKD